MDGGPITTAKIVDNIRKTMKDIAIVNVPIQAYIIPSVDAHQVKFKVPFQKFNKDERERAHAREKQIKRKIIWPHGKVFCNQTLAQTHRNT